MLTSDIRETFLYKQYFDLTKGFYYAGSSRAYLDFNRTLYLIEGETQEQRHIKRLETEEYLVFNLKLLIQAQIESQEKFDILHKQICLDLTEMWNSLKIGQAQKWLNMTLKYWVLFGSSKIRNIEQVAKYFHIPIDRYVQRGLFKDFGKSQKAWSRIDNYDEYMKYQIHYRLHNPKKIPLLEEFKFFNKINVNQEYDFYEKLQFWLGQNRIINSFLNEHLIIFTESSDKRKELFQRVLQERKKYLIEKNLSFEEQVFIDEDIKSPVKFYNLLEKHLDAIIFIYADISKLSKDCINILEGVICSSPDSGAKWPIRLDGKKELIFRGSIVFVTDYPYDKYENKKSKFDYLRRDCKEIN